MFIGVRQSPTAESVGASAGEILQSSFSTNDQGSYDLTLVAERKGLVNSIITAYNEHYALTLRPDDVWLAILTQFSAFVNGNAEELRHLFVSHSGKRSLTVRSAGDRFSVDLGHLAKEMTRLIHENVSDPSLWDWIMPNFTTTTPNDQTVGAILMMATFKKYFDYRFRLGCGLPRVTLEGEKSDWEALLVRIEKLKEYGQHTTTWYQLLHPILSRFVSAFDDPESVTNLDFWNTVAHFQRGGSGPSYYSGWITAFCVFDKDGRWIGPDSSTPKQPGLVLDDVNYHRLDSQKVPIGFAEVDVMLDDNGHTINTAMVAGMVASQFVDSEDLTLSTTGKLDTIHPVPGWWMYQK